MTVPETRTPIPRPLHCGPANWTQCLLSATTAINEKTSPSVPRDQVISGRRAQPPPEPELLEGEERFEIEEILDSQMWRKKFQYLVSWKGYGYEENSWVDERDVEAPRLVKEFYQKHPGAPRKIRTIRFGKSPFCTARVDTCLEKGVV